MVFMISPRSPPIHKAQYLPRKQPLDSIDVHHYTNDDEKQKKNRGSYFESWGIHHLA